MHLTRLASVVLLLSAVAGDAAAGLKSNSAAVTLVARVVPILRLQGEIPTATGATASVIGTGQNAFTLQFTMNGGDAALIQVPVVMRTNTNDLLLKASSDGATSGYIRMEGSAALAASITSRPMPLGPNVTFAIASGLLRTSAVGAPIPAMITIAVPPGAVPDGKRASVEITLEALRQ